MEKEKDLALSSAAQTRKSNKPIMEKRRRARINSSLTELKSLLLEVIKKEGTRHHKMEKADILELAVRHLKDLQKPNIPVNLTGETIGNKYQRGFAECAGEVTRYLVGIDNVDVDLKTRLLNHLANTLQNGPSLNVSQSNEAMECNYVTESGKGKPPIMIAPVSSASPDINNNSVSQGVNNGVDTITSSSLSNPSSSSSSFSMSSSSSSPLTVNTSIPGGAIPAQNNVMGALQLVPTKLPSGQIAFVLAGPQAQCAVPVYTNPQHINMDLSPVSSTGSIQEAAPHCSSTPLLVQPAEPIPLQESPQSVTQPLEITTAQSQPSKQICDEKSIRDTQKVTKKSQIINVQDNVNLQNVENEKIKDVMPIANRALQAQSDSMWRPW